LKDGSNNMRFFTDPFKFMTHKVRFSNDPRGKKGGWNVRCGGKGCALCAKAAGKSDLPDWLSDNLEVDKAKPRWYAGVIDREVEPNDAKTLELSVLIRGQIKDYAQSKKWGNPRLYDVDVKKNSKSKEPAGYYSVVPDPTDKGIVTPADEELMNNFNVEALEARCSPIGEDRIKEAVNRYHEWLSKSVDSSESAEPKKTNGKAKAKPVVEEKDEDDDDEVAEAEVNSNFNFSETTEGA